VRGFSSPSAVRVVLTLIRQQLEPQFVDAFIAAFVSTDWAISGGAVFEWPTG
jgi:hypothetical protein